MIGVTNKMTTVLVNALIWDQHASLSGIGALCVRARHNRAIQGRTALRSLLLCVAVLPLYTEAAQAQAGAHGGRRPPARSHRRRSVLPR